MTFREQLNFDDWTNQSFDQELEYSNSFSQFLSMETQEKSSEFIENVTLAPSHPNDGNEQPLQAKRLTPLVKRPAKTRTSTRNQTGKGVSYKDDEDEESEEEQEAQIARKLINKKKSCKCSGKSKSNAPKRNLWTEKEDEILKQLVQHHGPKWSEISKLMGGTRTGKQIRDRWTNKLDKCILEKEWTEEEDDLLISYWDELGNRWAEIAKYLGGRTESMVKNRFYSHIKKRRIDSKGRIIKEEFTSKIEEPSKCTTKMAVEEAFVPNYHPQTDSVENFKPIRETRVTGSTPESRRGSINKSIPEVTPMKFFESLAASNEHNKLLLETTSLINSAVANSSLSVANSGTASAVSNNATPIKMNLPSAALYSSFTLQSSLPVPEFFGLKQHQEFIQLSRRHSQEIINLNPSTGIIYNNLEDVFAGMEDDQNKQFSFRFDSRSGSNSSNCSASASWRLKMAQDALMRNIEGTKDVSDNEWMTFLSFNPSK